MKFRVVIEYDDQAASYAVYCPELPGCASAGDTEEEALANMREAVALYLKPSPVKISSNGKIYKVEVPA